MLFFFVTIKWLYLRVKNWYFKSLKTYIVMLLVRLVLIVTYLKLNLWSETFQFKTALAKFPLPTNNSKR